MSFVVYRLSARYYCLKWVCESCFDPGGNHITQQATDEARDLVGRHCTGHYIHVSQLGGISIYCSLGHNCFISTFIKVLTGHKRCPWLNCWLTFSQSLIHQYVRWQTTFWKVLNCSVSRSTEFCLICWTLFPF